jgi:hypothetical protein
VKIASAFVHEYALTRDEKLFLQQASDKIPLKCYIYLYTLKILMLNQLTSIPAWRDTLCGETNEGYFDFQQLERPCAQQISLEIDENNLL